MANERMTNVLAELEIIPRQTLLLAGRQRGRLLNFLLRWEHVEELHACLDVLVPANPTLVSLLDLRAKALLGQDEEALALVSRSLERGYSDPFLPLVIPPFQSLREDPRFLALFGIQDAGVDD